MFFVGLETDSLFLFGNVLFESTVSSFEGQLAVGFLVDRFCPTLSTLHMLPPTFRPWQEPGDSEKSAVSPVVLPPHDESFFSC